MFDCCRAWFNRLARGAGRALPFAESGAVEDHAAQRRECPAADEVSDVLRGVLQRPASLGDAEDVRAFDYRVVRGVREPVPPALSLPARILAALQQAHRSEFTARPVVFLTQLAGGAVFAASLTLLCFLSAVRATPTGVNASVAGPAPITQPESVLRVPIDALLDGPMPRSAELWVTPDSLRPRSAGHSPFGSRHRMRPKRSAMPGEDEHTAVDFGQQIG